jgi:uncharacterized protein with PQ loop repeat
MEIEYMQLGAGVVSSLIFAASNLPMLARAFKTRNMKSYSLGYIALSNVGNLVYWVYVVSLPFGPVWFLQMFYTLTMAVMLFLYLDFEKCVSLIKVLTKKRYAVCQM